MLKIKIMLIGEYKHSIDQKGRTSLPVKFKKEMGRGIYLSKGIDGMIDVYTKESWKELNQKLKILVMTKKKNRDFKRFILGASGKVEADKQGRILIPQALKEYANLSNNKKVIWTGVGDKAEIWAEDRWEKNKKENSKNIEDIAESLDGII